MSRFPREDYAELRPYDPGRTPIPLDLSDNTNLWGPHPAALDVARNAPPEVLTRYPSVYGRGLKEAVARKFGVPVTSVTTGCGSDDLLDSAFRASSFPPGTMAFPAPTFSMVEIFARMNGLDTLPVPWDRVVADPAPLLDGKPDLIYLCRPNNPTGHCVTREWVLDLLAQGGTGGPLVVLDEAYADFAEDDLIQHAPDSPRLLVLRTFSKLFGLAGLRVGFGVGHPEVVEEVEKSRGPYKVTALAEVAAAAALEDESGWAERIRKASIQNRDRLAGELATRGLRPLPSQGNFLLVPVAPAGAREVNQALKERGVAARPFLDLPGVGDAIRVTVGPWDLMERFLSALDDLLVSGRRGEVAP